MKKLLGIIVLVFLWTNIVYAKTYAIKITKYLIPDLTIDFTEYGIADETWRIVGTCKNAGTYSLVELTRYGIPDITVQLSKSEYGIVDRDICITNPDDLPDWFLEMLD